MATAFVEFHEHPATASIERYPPPIPGLEEKVKSFSIFNDCTVGQDDQTQLRKNLEPEKVNVQGQHPGPAECAEAVE